MLHVQGPPTRVGTRGKRNPGQLVEEELMEELVEELVELELVVADFVGEQDEPRT